MEAPWCICYTLAHSMLLMLSHNLWKKLITRTWNAILRLKWELKFVFITVFLQQSESLKDTFNRRQGYLFEHLQILLELYAKHICSQYCWLKWNDWERLNQNYSPNWNGWHGDAFNWLHYQEVCVLQNYKKEKEKYWEGICLFPEDMYEVG